VVVWQALEKKGANVEIENFGVVSDVGAAERMDKVDQEREVAAAKIQAAVRARSSKKKVSRMRSWQAKVLRTLEGANATIFAVALVVLSMLLELRYSESGPYDGQVDYPLVTMATGYFASFWFTFELILRFYCYAHIARGAGCDCADLDFFVIDKLRLMDLLIVAIDLAALFIETASANPEESGAVGMRFAKGGRILRLARLARFARVFRTLRLGSLAGDSARFRLTGKERIGMQRFEIRAPKDVDKGNRLEVVLPTLGKVHVDWPLYAAYKCPIQFHLPVVCGHHLNKKVGRSAHQREILWRTTLPCCTEGRRVSRLITSSCNFRLVV